MKYLHALNKVPGIGPQKTRILLNKFENAENVWRASLDDLKCSGIGEKTAENLFSGRKTIDPDLEWKRLEEENISIITYGSKSYPELLSEIPNPPYVLYKKGGFDLNSAPLIGIVGSRKSTSYGAQTAYNFSKLLSQAGLAIVSGMAIGIDSFAHRGTIESDGHTIAVLGNSLDDKSIYPRVNFNLSRQISVNGCLISEYPPETPAGSLTFPARNRIIAGMSRGLLVVEAGEKSGALITAQMALDYNRDIFSVPGTIFSPSSVGTNDLIKKGARMVTCVNDVLEELDCTSPRQEFSASGTKIPETENEKIILGILSGEPIHIDIISKLSRLKSFEVSSTLSVMEIKGWAKNIGGQNYIIL